MSTIGGVRSVIHYRSPREVLGTADERPVMPPKPDSSPSFDYGGTFLFLDCQIAVRDVQTLFADLAKGRGHRRTTLTILARESAKLATLLKSLSDQLPKETD